MRQNRGQSPACAAIAQLVERLICNQQVESSILSGGFELSDSPERLTVRRRANRPPRAAA